MCLLLQTATDYLEGEKYVSISAIVPIIKGLAEKYSSSTTDSIIMADFRVDILAQLKSRFEFVFGKFDNGLFSTHAHLFMFTWLDPKFRRTYYKNAPIEAGVQVSYNEFLMPCELCDSIQTFLGEKCRGGRTTCSSANGYLRLWGFIGCARTIYVPVPL